MKKLLLSLFLVLSSTLAIFAGTGTKTDPYTVADVIAKSSTENNIWVKGFIVGYFKSSNSFIVGATGATVDRIALGPSADSKKADECMNIVLSKNTDARDINLKDHSDYVGKEVLLFGNIGKTYGKMGLSACSKYEFVSQANPNQLSFEKHQYSVNIGETLLARLNNPGPKTVKYTSSDTKVATVAADGTVTGVSVGTATITATATDDATNSASYELTVNDPNPVSAPVFTPASGAALYADDKVTITADEGATITYSINGGASQNYTPDGISFTEDGEYTIVATATLNGQTKTATATYTYATIKPKSIGAVRVTSADNVIEGASYVLALNDKAMGKTLGSNYINTVGATYNEDKTLKVTEDLGIVKFEPSTLADDEGKWHLKVQNYGENGGYIKSLIDEGNKCTISNNPEHSAEISFNNEDADDVRVEIKINKNSYLAANNGSNRYSCYNNYGSSMSRPCLYALPAESVEPPKVTMPTGYETADDVDLEVFSKGYEGENAWFVITVTWNPGLKLHYETTSLGSEVDDVKIKFPSTGSSTGTDTPAKAAAKVAASHDITVGNKATFKFGSEGMFTCYTVDAAGNRAEAAPFSVNFKGESTGVEDITVDDQNGVAVYYNMQGVRVAYPAAGGLYIKVQGKKATKVLVK